MPKALTTKAGALLDSWGRSNNRKLLDKTCPHCGSKFKPLKATSRYCSRPCSWANNGGHNAKHESWWINSRGYVEGRTTVDGTKVRIKQHRHVAAITIGRELLPHEDVHHKNGDKTDNRPENLEVLSHGEHSSAHNKVRTYRRGYCLNLTDAERARRSDAMREMRRAAIAKAKGGAA